MQIVKADAQDQHRIVVATIHQPSLELLCQFDKILLMANGAAVFFGPPLEALDYFKANGGFQPRPAQNPADFCCLRIPPVHQRKSKKTIKESITFATRTENDTSSDRTSSSAPPIKETLNIEDNNVPNTFKPPTSWPNSWATEFRLLLQRSWIQIIRNTSMTIAGLIRSLILIVLIGFAFFRLKLDQNGVQNRVGILFFWPVNNVPNAMVPVVTVFPLERTIMIRERSKPLYTPHFHPTLLYDRTRQILYQIPHMDFNSVDSERLCGVCRVYCGSGCDNRWSGSGGGPVGVCDVPIVWRVAYQQSGSTSGFQDLAMAITCEL
jgi:ATP-binding cassette subfamily G (WHITE) protein 2